jgi:hypothetical protein
MSSVHTSSPQRKSLLIGEYASELARIGTRIVPGTSGTFWVRYESGAMMRIPTFHMAPPAPDELQRVLHKGRAVVVSYVRNPDASRPANVWLYICTDQTYALDKLAPAVRRNVNRGFKQLRIVPITSKQLLGYGAQAFCDTRRRVGLTDGTPQEFYRRFRLRAKCPAHVFIGAWKDDTLAAFVSITEVDDWAEIEGCFSMDALLNSRPNDALMFYLLSHYLVKGASRVVSYGASSIQSQSHEVGLHMFKTKVGFEARPVHRVFVLHPLVRPFANQLTLWGVNTALRFMPGVRQLKKAHGVLACLLREKQLAQVEMRTAKT